MLLRPRRIGGTRTMALSGHSCGAAIDEQGRLVLDDQEAFRTANWRMKHGQRVKVTVEPEKDHRTAVANRYHWGVVIWTIADETGQDEDSIHYDMCDRFLRRRIQYVDISTGRTVEREFAIGSSGLTVREFYDFVEKCRLFAAEFFGLSIPDPDREYRRVYAELLKEAA